MVVGSVRCGLRFQPVDPGEGQALVRRPCSLDGAEWKVGRFNTGFGQRVDRVDFPTLGKPTIPHLNPMIKSP